MGLRHIRHHFANFVEIGKTHVEIGPTCIVIFLDDFRQPSWISQTHHMYLDDLQSLVFIAVQTLYSHHGVVGVHSRS